MRRSLALLALAALPLVPTAARAQSAYTFTDLGASPRTADGINRQGQVCGTVTTNNETRAYRWTDANSNGVAEAGEFQILPVPKGYGYAATPTNAQHINSSGQVAGVVQKSSTLVPEFGYVWNAAGTTGSILTTSQGIQKVSTEAFGINDRGDVVGINYGNSRDPQCAYLWKWTGSAYTAVRISGTVGAFDINAARQVVGWTALDAFVWSESGGLTVLGRLAGHSGEAVGQAVNDAGVVVGSTGLYANNFPNGSRHAYLWVPSVDNGSSFTAFDLHPDGASSSGIDDVGDVVRTPVAGGEQLTFQAVGEVSGRAARWDVVVTRVGSSVSATWTAIDLNDRVDPTFGRVLTAARAINAEGKIVCRYLVTGGNRPVVLTPSAP